MINCGSVFPAYPSFVYPVPQSTTQAGSRPAIFLLACCCRCRRRLLRAAWGQGLAAGDGNYLTIHSRAALSVRGGSWQAEAVARKQQARSAATTAAPARPPSASALRPRGPGSSAHPAPAAPRACPQLSERPGGSLGPWRGG